MNIITSKYGCSSTYVSLTSDKKDWEIIKLPEYTILGIRTNWDYGRMSWCISLHKIDRNIYRSFGPEWMPYILYPYKSIKNKTT